MIIISLGFWNHHRKCWSSLSLAALTLPVNQTLPSDEIDFLWQRQFCLCLRKSISSKGKAWSTERDNLGGRANAARDNESPSQFISPCRSNSTLWWNWFPLTKTILSLSKEEISFFKSGIWTIGRDMPGSKANIVRDNELDHLYWQFQNPMEKLL